MLEGMCKVALEQRHISLHASINEMANENKCSDEIALYILSRMYRKHSFIYTQMFWWTSLLYTLPVQERDLVDRCEIVLVYLKPGVFGELQKIRPPTATVTSPEKTEAPEDLLLSPVIPQNAKPDANKQDVEKDSTTTSVITEGAVNTVDISTGNTMTVSKNNLSDISSSVPTSTPCHKPQANQPRPDPPVPITPVLPSINIFMTQRCSIPLIRCDYESALKAAGMHHKVKEMSNEYNISSSVPALPVQSDENVPLCTSGRTRTVINYKQFLEEYADAPPSPPKRRSEIDLRLK